MRVEAAVLTPLFMLGAPLREVAACMKSAATRCDPLGAPCSNCCTLHRRMPLALTSGIIFSMGRFSSNLCIPVTGIVGQQPMQHSPTELRHRKFGLWQWSVKFR